MNGPPINPSMWKECNVDSPVLELACPRLLATHSFVRTKLDARSPLRTFLRPRCGLWIAIAKSQRACREEASRIFATLLVVDRTIKVCYERTNQKTKEKGSKIIGNTYAT